MVSMVTGSPPGVAVRASAAPELEDKTPGSLLLLLLLSSQNNIKMEVSVSCGFVKPGFKSRKFTLNSAQASVCDLICCVTSHLVRLTLFMSVMTLLKLC